MTTSVIDVEVGQVWTNVAGEQRIVVGKGRNEYWWVEFVDSTRGVNYTHPTPEWFITTEWVLKLT